MLFSEEILLAEGDIEFMCNIGRIGLGLYAAAQDDHIDGLPALFADQRIFELYY
jgi:hypothetical protein